jgi:hypothetical protein
MACQPMAYSAYLAGENQWLMAALFNGGENVESSQLAINGVSNNASVW